MTKDVEMKEHAPPPSNSVTSTGPSTLQHLKEIASLIEIGVYVREVRQIVRHVRLTIALKQKLKASMETRQDSMNSATHTRETKQVEGEASVFRNLKLPANEFPNQEPSHPTTTKSPASSYRIFSAPKAIDTSIKENVATESNRYKKGSSSNSKRDPTPVRVSANPSSRTSRSDGSGRAGVGKGGQGRWGRFSSENSNVIPSKNTETQAKVQR
ncbi:unnamed protein product [Ilex paraguariensis]|uniref:Uncharacterized protein n=1 Tax=Ilex paraguariensis TaxID=185542 RepID=A0ABC8S9R6_9AQUA